MASAAVSTSDNEKAYVAFVDRIIYTYLPGKSKHQELYDLVELYQIHRHSRTCRKLKNETSRFTFGNCSTKETVAAEALSNSMPEETKTWVSTKEIKY